MPFRSPWRGAIFIALVWTLCAFLAPQASANGVVVTSLPRGTQGRDLITGPDGAIWFNAVYGGSAVRPARGLIARIGPNQDVTEYPLSKEHMAGAPIIGPGGDIWVPDSYGYSGPGYGIARLSMTGQLQEYKLGSSGTDWIEGIAALGDDIWAGVVLESKRGYVDRPFIERIATSPDVSVEQRFALPSGCMPTALAAGAEAIWFAEVCTDTKLAYSHTHACIVRINTQGESARYCLQRRSVVGSLAVGPDGSVWFGSLTYNSERGRSHSEFGRIAPTGERTSYRVPDADPTIIAIGPEGRLWFRSSFGGSVYRAVRSIGPQGDLSERICTGPRCGLEADGLIVRPSGEIWFSATEAHPPPTGGGGSIIGENMRREEEAGVLGLLAP